MSSSSAWANSFTSESRDSKSTPSRLLTLTLRSYSTSRPRLRRFANHGSSVRAGPAAISPSQNPRDAVLLAVVVRIVLEARVEVRVGDHRDGAKQGLDRDPGGRRPVSRTGRPERITPSVTRTRRSHVAVYPRPRLAVGGRLPQCGENGTDHPSLGAAESCGVGGGQGSRDVCLHEWAAQGAGIGDRPA